MKKIYNKIKSLTFALSLVALQAGAQMNGVVTIDNTSPASSTNFTSFTTFAAMVNSVGVNGALVVNVVTGTGPYVEQVTFNVISGASSVNKITINGNGCLLTFNATSTAPWTMLLNGTDWLSVNNLKLEGTNASYAMVCVLTAGADYNTFSTCSFSCPLNGTSSYHVPFALSSSNMVPTGGSNSGNYNTVETSTLTNGYYGAFMYGLTGAPYQTDNKLIRNLITDYYIYGVYAPYNKNLLAKQNILQRPLRTSSSTCYGFLCYYNQGLMADGNKLHKMYESNMSYTGTFYGFYGYYNSVGNSQNRNTYRNNIICDINFNGSIYGTYLYYMDGDFVNNTLSFDYAGSTSGNVYAIYYTYGGSGYTNNFINNNVSVTRAGSGTKYGIYTGSTGGATYDRNNYYVNSPGGTNYTGWYNGNATTLAQLQALGIDLNSYNLNPNFASLATGDLHPTNVALNNLAMPWGILFDQQDAVRHQTTPDVGALEFLTPLCTGTPTSTISGPSFSLCPGETANFLINGLSSDAGITYQWQVSTVSSVGPFTNINGATNITHSAPNQTATTWYSAVITCTNPGGGATTPVWQVNISGPTMNTVPYYEGFEGIGLPNRLPNCSWFSPNIGSTAFTYNSATTQNRLPRNGTSFGSFANTTPGANYFYTNGIWLEPGITYSAAVWYQTDFTGSANWTDLSLLIGTSQTSAGLMPVATTGGAAISPVYKLLSNTFTVATAAYHYLAIRGTAAAGTAMYLSLDDVSITIPCTATLNPVPLAVAANNNTVCSGTAVNLTASGANTYVWNTGNTGSNNSQFPSVNPSVYSVIGTNTLTGCSTSVSKTIYVKQSPLITVASFPPVSCQGQPVTLSAAGGITYLWSNSNNGAIITVTPNANTSYTVIGTNSLNCSSSAVVGVQVRNNPTVTVNGPQQICVGESATLIGSGANSFQFMAASAFIQSNPAVVTPNTPTTYTVVGTDAYGCAGTVQYNLNVDACTGLNNNTLSSKVMVYPNPATAALSVVLSSGTISSLEVIDLTGRIVLKGTATDSHGTINMENLANGVYYVKVAAGNSVDVIKVVKN
jgi:hypothetical protein